MSNSKIERKNLNTPDKTMKAGKIILDTVKLAGYNISQLTMYPGAKWSTDMKPIAKTDSCKNQHIGVVISGRVNVQMNNGTEIEYGPGDVYSIPPNHNGWTVGNEPMVSIEWTQSTD